MNLTLVYPLTYKQTNKSYSDFINSIYQEEIGLDKILKYTYAIEDETIKLDFVSSGEKSPLTDEEKKVIESGQEPLKRPEENYLINSGKYSFSQLAPVDNEQDLSLLIFGECEKFSGDVYIRLFKENAFEIIMQFFFPQEQR